MVVEKDFDVAMSTTKLSLCNVYNHLGVLSHMETVYTFCIQKLYKMHTTDFYKVYTKCIPYFDKLSYTFCIQNQKSYNS